MASDSRHRRRELTAVFPRAPGAVFFTAGRLVFLGGAPRRGFGPGFGLRNSSAGRVLSASAMRTRAENRTSAARPPSMRCTYLSDSHARSASWSWVRLRFRRNSAIRRPTSRRTGRCSAGGVSSTAQDDRSDRRRRKPPGRLHWTFAGNGSVRVDSARREVVSGYALCGYEIASSVTEIYAYGVDLTRSCDLMRGPPSKGETRRTTEYADDRHGVKGDGRWSGHDGSRAARACRASVRIEGQPHRRPADGIRAPHGRGAGARSRRDPSARERGRRRDRCAR